MFGANMREKRKEMGITTAELAQALCTSEQMVRHYESGFKVPSLATALAIAKTLHTTVDELANNQPT